MLALAAIAAEHERIKVREGAFHRRAPGEVLQPERESAAASITTLKRQLFRIVRSKAAIPLPASFDGPLCADMVEKLQS